MKTHKLDPGRWHLYLNAQAPHIRTTRAEVHVLDPARDRFVKTWDVGVRAITYDRANHSLRLLGDDFEHIVLAPRSVQAMEGPAGELLALEITAGDGIRHIISLRRPLALAGA